MVVPTPFIGIDDRPGGRRLLHEAVQGLLIRMLHHLESDRARVPSHDPEHRGAVVLHGPMPSSLVRPTSRWIVRIRMRNPFFSGILVHLIPFHHGVLQRRSIQTQLYIRLHPMSKFKKIPSTATQFPSQLRGRHSLSSTDADSLVIYAAGARP